jgi:hypothetical protein
MKNKKILIILNGKPTAGKDTVVLNVKKQFGDEYVLNLSSIDLVMQAARILGWKGEKNPDDRNFLAGLKDLSTSYNDGPFHYIAEETITSNAKIIFAHLREPSEIQKLYDYFKDRKADICPFRVFVDRDVEVLATNHADNNTSNTDYDYYINNHGTLLDLEKATKTMMIKLFEDLNIYEL